jgi:hypothetical protein
LYVIDADLETKKLINLSTKVYQHRKKKFIS